MAVGVPLTDLRAQPHTTAQPDTRDPLQETQLVYGERVKVLKTEDGWSQIEAVEQQEFTHARRWQGYPGWVPASALVPWESLLESNIVVTAAWAQTWTEAYLLTPSPWRFPLGTRLRATDMAGQRWMVELLDGRTIWMRYDDAQTLEELRARSPLEQRRTVLRNAQLLLGDRYYWGGRSPQLEAHEEWVTGIDCSGLVNLAYRSAGIDIPRDAHEQFLRAKPVSTPQPADLVFLSERDNPTRIVHVMLYAGEGQLIEGPGTGLTVRRIAVEQRLGQRLDWLASGTVVDGQTVSYGTYLP